MDHKDLEAWKRAMDLVEEVYSITRKLPRDEQFGLVSQMRRSAISIPSNLSEGAGRSSHKELSHFLSICMGSLAELETQLLLVGRLGYAEPEETLNGLIHVRALTAGMKRSIASRQRRS